MEKIAKLISWRLQFIEDARLIANLLSNPVRALAKETHKIKCRYGYQNEGCKHCVVKCQNCECCFECTNVKDDLIE